MLGSGNWLPDEDGEYFIDRNPIIFGRILDFLRTGELNCEGLDNYHKKVLDSDLDFYLLRDIVENVSVVENVSGNEFAKMQWVVGESGQVSENGKRFTAISDRAFAYVDYPIDTSKPITLKISFKTAWWLHICLGSQKFFQSVGNYYASQGGTIPFMYFPSSGSVNYVSGFTQALEGYVELKINNRSVTFLVDGHIQTGNWSLPEIVYLLVDPYHSGNTVKLEN